MSGQEGSSPSVPTPRRQWPAQRGTVVDILNSAAICEATRGATIAIKSSKLGADTRVVEPCVVVGPREVAGTEGAEVVGESNEAASDVPKMKENKTEDVGDENLNDVEVKS